MNKDSIPHELLQAHLAGTADEQQAAALSQWVVASPEHAAFLSSLSWLDLALSQQSQNEAVDRLSRQERAFLDRVDPDAWEMFLNSALRNAKQREAIEPASFHLDNEQAQADSITFGQLRSVSGYLLMKGLRSKAGITSSIAAVLLIGVLLVVAMTGPAATPTADPIVKQSPAPESNAIVATLTAEHDAAWQALSGTSTPGVGDGLHAGQRLTLSDGFVEITTRRGAIAVIEAPATIELIDNDNALRLHAGKLVGICETDASQGFLVRTPHMDVIDLGTRFGVAIDPAGNTLTEVFDGSVRVDANPQNRSGFESIQMKAGDTVVLDQDGAVAERFLFEPTAFARLRNEMQATVQAGIDQVSGQVRLVDQLNYTPTNIDELPKSDEAWVCLELPGHTLTEAVPTTAHAAGAYTQLLEANYGSIPAGTRIRSYVIGFRPGEADDASLSGLRKVDGEVTFAGEILGVIATEQHLKQFIEAVSSNATTALFPGIGTMIETQSKAATGRDQFEIKPDGRTLAFHFEVTHGIDMIRVIVREGDPTNE